MNTLKHWVLAILFATTVGGSVFSIAAPQTAGACSTQRILTFPAWYEGIVTSGSCEIKSPTEVGGLSKFIWTIALNIVELILQLVGYLAVGFIIYGGFLYMTAAGSPDGMSKAKKTITNAVVGLLLSIFSVAIVNLISGAL